jgi:hypothetical protein
LIADFTPFDIPEFAAEWAERSWFFCTMQYKEPRAKEEQ